jgi:hypothetical protein
MDRAVIDDLKVNQWIMFANKPKDSHTESTDYPTMMMMAMPNQSGDSTPQMFLLTPFYLTNVSIPFVTGYYLHTNRTPMTFPVYKYDIFKVPPQVSSLYKEHWVSSICNNVPPSELTKMLPFLPEWFTKTKIYKKVKELYYEEEQRPKNIRNLKR